MLTPRGAVGLVVNRHRLELAVVVTEVDDHLGKTRLEAGNRLQVELLPLVARHLRTGDDHPVEQNVLARDARLRRGERAAFDGEKREMIVMSYLDVSGNELGRGEKRAHVAIQMCRTNPDL